MFDDLFKKIDSGFSFKEHKKDEVAWRNNVKTLISCFSKDATPFLKKIYEGFPKRLLNDSEQEYISFNCDHVLLFEYRLRPFDDYYNKFNKTLPSPKNPDGPHATGIKVSISATKGFQARNIMYPAALDVEFQVWGQRERDAFKEFYANYKRIIDLFLTKANYEFFCSCIFKNLKKEKKATVPRQLELYLKNKIDQENTFSISAKYYKTTNVKDIFRGFKILLAFYDCCYGYASFKKDADRILKYIYLLEE